RLVHGSVSCAFLCLGRRQGGAQAAIIASFSLRQSSAACIIHGEKKPLVGGGRDLRKRAMADAAAKLAPTIDARAAIDAIPRSYNFAADIIERNLKAGRANKPVYIDPRGSWTYGELAERVDRCGHVLRSLGVRREERILLALLDTIDWPTAFLGAIKAGVVPIPVNTLMTEDDYRFMLADSRAKVLVVSEAL